MPHSPTSSFFLLPSYLAYRLSRRNIARIVAAISAAMLWSHSATAALSPADKALMRRASGAMCTILPIEDSMPDGEPHVAVSDHGE